MAFTDVNTKVAFSSCSHCQVNSCKEKPYGLAAACHFGNNKIYHTAPFCFVIMKLYKFDLIEFLGKVEGRCRQKDYACSILPVVIAKELFL